MKIRDFSAFPAALIVALLALTGPVRAASPPPDALPAIAAAVDRAQSDLHALSAATPLGRLDDTAIKTRMARLPPVQAKLADVIAVLTPRLRDADAGLAQLGPAPGPGQPPEAPDTAGARRDLVRYRQAVQSHLAEARLLSVEADQLSAELAERLRGNFQARLWKRSRSILDPGLWGEFATAQPEGLKRLRRAWADESEALSATGRTPAVLTWLALTGLFGLLLVGPGRVLLGRLGYRRAEALGPPTPLGRTVLAVWLVAVAAATPPGVGFLIQSALNAAGATTPIVDEFVGLVIKVSFFAALIEGLGRAVLSPRHPAWRIAPIPDGLVARLAPWPGLIGASGGLQMFVAGANSILGSSLPMSVATDCLTLLLTMAVVGAFLWIVARARDARWTDGGVEGEGGEAGRGADSPLPWILAASAAWVALGTAVGAVLLGYLALATILMRETIWVACVLTILSLLLRLADELFPALFSPSGPLGRPVQAAIGVSDGALKHFAVILSGLARLAVFLLAWGLILVPFGASIGEIFSRIASGESVLHLGAASISPGLVLQGLALFLLALFLTRAVRGWLVKRYLPTTRLDVGVRTSVAAGVSYLGVLIAVVLTFAYLGLSFSQIALFASALSVGIGFGLQAIIGNFVSGLILLAERPVKPGDWIAIGDQEGDVKRISIRATEIEMFDRSRLIVPNSDLISKTVRNVTHSVAVGRVKIVLRLDDQADPDLAHDLILEKLAAHPAVLAAPKAGVFMTDMSNGAMEFTALAYVATPRQSFGVKSELLFQIARELKARGIALSNSNPVVNVGLAERVVGSAT